MTSQDQRLRGPARALLVIEQRVLSDVVRLALNHGHYNTRVAQTVNEAATALVRAFLFRTQVRVWLPRSARGETSELWL